MAFQDVTPGVGTVSTNGRMIAVAATSTPGTLLHTAVTGITKIDSITIYAVNNHANTVRLLTVEFGGTSASDLIQVEIPPKVGLSMIVRGGRLNNGLAVRAFADAANDVNCKIEVDTIELQ